MLPQISQQDLTSERDRLRLLLDVNNAVVSSLSLRDLLFAVSGWLRKFFPLDFASMVIRDEATGMLKVHALDAPAPGGVLNEGAVLPLEGTPPGIAIATRQTVHRDRLDFNEFYSPIMREAYNAGLRCGISVPLISHDQVLGTINVGSLSEAAFTRKDAELLEQIAGQVAIAVENALNFERAERALCELAALKNKLVSEKLYLEEEIQTEYNFEEIIGKSAALKKILQQVATVAPTDSAVLLCGETGTGKELIARAIHNLSNRRERTLVKLNCAAIPTGLLESELFGHEKGAFTGAIAQRVGRFELANKGTLLLDEVGEIPLDLQPKLLRVLQELEFERLGSSRTIKTDARMIAATNVDLPQMVAEKKFRSDLYYRLNVFPITIPPLRERVDDIPLLIGYFAQKHALRMNKRIDRIEKSTVDALCEYPWPGNVRELENFMERSVILSSGSKLQAPLGELKVTTTMAVSQTSAASKSLEDVERQHIIDVLEQTRGVIGGKGGAAEILGLPTSTLRNRMKKLGLK
ncbi:MAG TPA: sigma 54-interacting transcriptional regulator [Pyrinomonadaceae bacterium]|nr:sigma 54-interacting transcriptional regulator [Pyrinomonadaceae bacterium]